MPATLPPFDYVDLDRLSPVDLERREADLVARYAQTCATLRSFDDALPARATWDGPPWLRARVLEFAELAERIERAVDVTRRERARRLAVVR